MLKKTLACSLAVAAMLAAGSAMADTKDKKIFRDSLVENARDMVQLLADFNLTGDDAMDRARVRLMDALDGVTPEALREDDMFRHDVKRKVDAIIKDFAW